MFRFLAPFLLLAPLTFGDIIVEVQDATAGHLSVDLDGQSVVRETFEVIDKTGTWVGGDLAGTGFSYSATWNKDPFISWTYNTSKSGKHLVKFDIPIFSDTYALIFQSAGYTLTTKKGAGASSIKNVSVKAYIPWPDVNANLVPEGFVTVADTAIPAGGTLTKSDDNTNNGGTGPFVAFGPRTVSSLGLVLEFDAALPAGASDVSFNGTLSILPQAVPEPATFALIGVALVGLGSLYRRRSA
ncbi:MAG: PEP-CTERM sorting domain-containing protein [Acidobacteria bacterium]|nr:PEP-CTERM sorting domain-containing protein [Acidobacteriota bacterium]